MFEEIRGAVSAEIEGVFRYMMSKQYELAPPREP